MPFSSQNKKTDQKEVAKAFVYRSNFYVYLKLNFYTRFVTLKKVKLHQTSYSCLKMIGSSTSNYNASNHALQPCNMHALTAFASSYPMGRECFKFKQFSSKSVKISCYTVKHS